MAEGIVFVLLGAIVTSVLVVVFGWHQWVDPRWIVIFFFVLLLPGLWGAFTTGPFVPSGKKRYKTMLKLAAIRPSDTVYELGCGDATLILQAAKIAKKATGYEIAIPLVLWGKLRRLVTASKAHIRFADIWKQDYADADVILCYLMPNAMRRFYRDIWPGLKPGTRVISNAFRIHELTPTQEEESVFMYKKP